MAQWTVPHVTERKLPRGLTSVGDGVKVEPSADQRAAARNLFALHTALTDQGFTEAQSLAILGQTILAAMQSE
jgi:hypothetical protein